MPNCNLSQYIRIGLEISSFEDLSFSLFCILALVVSTPCWFDFLSLALASIHIVSGNSIAQTTTMTTLYWLHLGVYFITYYLTLSEPIIDSKLQPLDVVRYLNLNTTDPAIKHKFVSIYELQEANFLATNETLIYVEPRVLLTWQSLNVDFEYGLYNLITGNLISATSETSLSSSRKFWLFQRDWMALDDSQAETQDHEVIPMSSLRNLYPGSRLTQLSFLLALAKFVLNILLHLLCLLVILLELRTLLHVFVVDWRVKCFVLSWVVLLRMIYLIIIAIYNKSAPSFGLSVAVHSSNLVALMLVFGNILYDRSAGIAVDTNAAQPNKPLSLSSLSGLDVITSPFDEQRPPTVDVIKSLSSHEEKVPYNGRIHPPMTRPPTSNTECNEENKTQWEMADTITNSPTPLFTEQPETEEIQSANNDSKPEPQEDPSKEGEEGIESPLGADDSDGPKGLEVQ